MQAPPEENCRRWEWNETNKVASTVCETADTNPNVKAIVRRVMESVEDEDDDVEAEVVLL